LIFFYLVIDLGIGMGLAECLAYIAECVVKSVRTEGTLGV